MASFVNYIVTTLTSSSISTYLVTITTVLLLHYIYRRMTCKKRNIPPGPLRLPFVGSLPFHGFSPADFTTLSKKYGPICTIYVGSERCIILNSYDVMKEALVDKYQDFMGRGAGWVVKNTNPKQYGIIQADYNDNMRRYRNESLSILRTLGFGKAIMETKIKREVDELAQVFASKHSAPFEPGPIITIFVTNIIYSVLCNQRFSPDDKKMLDTIKTCDEWMATGMNIFILDYFPFLRPIPSMKKAFQTYVECNVKINAFLDEDRQKHFDSHQPGMDSDFVHALIDKHLDLDTNNIDIDIGNLTYIMRDFFIAGTETTTNSVKWTILLMANHPEMQNKAHTELDTTIGGDAVGLKDKDHLPYIEAIIWEVQRFKTIAPLSVAKYVHRDTTLAGYDIPGNTRILQNTEYVHMNPETWGDPQTFRPERFLNESGAFVRHPHLIPFSLGKRQCLGEVLARQELFLFTAILLHKFRFEPIDGVTSIDEEGILGFTSAPKPFQMKAIPR